MAHTAVSARRSLPERELAFAWRLAVVQLPAVVQPPGSAQRPVLAPQPGSVKLLRQQAQQAKRVRALEPQPALASQGLVA